MSALFQMVWILWFMQGRALLNAVGNLELKDEYSEALHKLGHDLEAVAEQVLSFSGYCVLVCNLVRNFAPIF